MTWMQVGVSAAVASAALLAWFGIWSMADRRFTELRRAIDKANESNDKAHGELREVAGDVKILAGDVKILVGRQQERDLASQRTAD